MNSGKMTWLIPINYSVGNILYWYFLLLIYRRDIDSTWDFTDVELYLPLSLHNILLYASFIVGLFLIYLSCLQFRRTASAKKYFIFLFLSFLSLIIPFCFLFVLQLILADDHFRGFRNHMQQHAFTIPSAVGNGKAEIPYGCGCLISIFLIIGFATVFIMSFLRCPGSY